MVSEFHWISKTMTSLLSTEIDENMIQGHRVDHVAIVLQSVTRWPCVTND